MCRVFYTYIDNCDSISSKDKRRQSSLAAYKLLSEAAKLCGYDCTELNIIRSEKGKPYVENGEFYFSISHCDSFVCVAISQYEVGIDAQRIGDVSDKVIERFLKEKPLDDIFNTYLWTDFEAVGKYFGVGIPHCLVLDTNARITHLKCGEYCVSVCHNATDECAWCDNIILVKE